MKIEYNYLMNLFVTQDITPGGSLPAAVAYRHYSTEPLDLKNLVQSIIPLFENKSVILFESKGTDFTILADKKMLGQVLNNLINNALQATQETVNPVIQITIASKDKLLTLAVKDNGVGISEAAKEKIFTPYFTTKSSGTLRMCIQQRIWFLAGFTPVQSFRLQISTHWHKLMRDKPFISI